ncbi:hypothetical protein CHS0354_005007 [Potamilus streckersoni]|uniref:Mucin-like protein n=1 Tax=Potamilus streckersoni TaxID=2493646 RepID=A0AAE0STD4_9BIVA|nr:hypothetical protein CHS0354_005007 [Potamilus streckersoni]
MVPKIVEITTISPRGFMKSDLAEYPSIPGAWYVNISWTPSTSDANNLHFLCFKATDELGLASQQRCINIIVSPDIVIDGSNEHQFQYGSYYKDGMMSIKDGKCKLVSKESYVPIFRSNYTNIFVCISGIVTFDAPFESPGTDDGSNLKGRAILAPYFTDIDTESLIHGGNVYYHVYNVMNEEINDAINIKTAEEIIRQIHRDVEDFKTTFALFVTWQDVLPYQAEWRNKERMNFQLALITDGLYTFAFYIYIKDRMKLSAEQVFIGFTSKDGEMYTDYRSFMKPVLRMDKEAQSYGYMGLLHYRLTFPSPGSENPYQRCINLYLNESKNKEIYNNESGPDAGGFIRYHPYRRGLEHQTYDIGMRNICCVENKLCSLYYSVRPIGKCYTIPPAWHAPARGDPHIKTLDGNNYTFNGWGEFTLLKLNSSFQEFELQARTSRAVKKNGNLSDATVFSAFAARDKYDARIHIEMNADKTGLIVYARMASDLMLTDYTRDYMNFNTDFNIVSSYLSLSRNKETNDLRAVFSSGIGFTVGISVNMLNIDVVIPEKFRGMTSGLLGNFDGNPANDFQCKNGTILTDTMQERRIYEFGKTWAVEANQSAFWYPRGKGFYDYAYLNYTPKFLEDADNRTVANAQAYCGSEEEECIFDLVFTGNEAVANNTRSLGQVARETEKTLANQVPTLSGPTNVNITANRSLTYELHAIDDGEVTYQILDGHAFANITQQTNGSAVVHLLLSEGNPINVIVTVVDNFGVQASPHQPTIVFCSNCSRRGTCDFGNYLDDIRTTFTFKYASCKCEPYWDGPDCHDDRDGCATHPCSSLRICTDIPADIHKSLGVGYNCSECPKGFHSTNDGRCEDIDECNATIGVCTQICNNTYGSYKCSCNQGYRNQAGSDICQDVNECLDGTNNCDQICNNYFGGYNCSCYDGFVFNNTKRRCEAAGTAPVGCEALNCNGTAGCTTDEHGNATCFCKKGFQLSLDQNACVDINECQLALCEHDCTNTDGGFFCSCFNGYILDANSFSCKHVDECQDPELNTCQQSCQNDAGGFSCSCYSGYVQSKNDTKLCQDINECADRKTNRCSDNCTNVNGGYICSCPAGYRLDNDERTCIACDAFHYGPNCSLPCNCGIGAVKCDPVNGCLCKTGWKGANCDKDVDECATRPCTGGNSTCINTIGSYVCDCVRGYMNISGVCEGLITINQKCLNTTLYGLNKAPVGASNLERYVVGTAINKAIHKA